MPEYVDGPFLEVAARADKLIEQGHTVHFKWTCEACGERVGFNEPNTLYTRGAHDDCPADPGHENSLEENGCNYLVIITSDDTRRAEQRSN